MQYNLWFYHTSDRKPTLLHYGIGLEKAQEQLAANVAYHNSVGQPMEEAGKDRYEYRSNITRWGFALYIEPVKSNTMKNSDMKLWSQ